MQWNLKQMIGIWLIVVILEQWFNHLPPSVAGLLLVKGLVVIALVHIVKVVLAKRKAQHVA